MRTLKISAFLVLAALLLGYLSALFFDDAADIDWFMTTAEAEEFCNYTIVDAEEIAVCILAKINNVDDENITYGITYPQLMTLDDSSIPLGNLKTSPPYPLDPHLEVEVETSGNQIVVKWSWFLSDLSKVGIDIFTSKKPVSLIDEQESADS